MGTDDRLAIRVLLGNSSDSRPREFRHFLYVPEQAKAEALAARLRADGFEVECRRGATGDSWLVRVRHLSVPEEAAIEALADQLTNLVEEMSGEYDGWDVEVQ